MEFSVESPINVGSSFFSEETRDFKIPQNVVSPALFVLIGIVGVFSIVMIYHWFTYGKSKILSLSTLVVYLCGILFLLGGIIDIVTKLAK